MAGIGQGGFQGMTWNGSGNFGGMNGMAPFMANPMYNFPNPMGMLNTSHDILKFVC